MADDELEANGIVEIINGAIEGPVSPNAGAIVEEHKPFSWL